MYIPITIPKKVSFYYGYPSSVNATYTVTGAVNVFKEYDVVVFGDGLQDPNHQDYQNLVDIMNHPDMTNTEVFGYIDSTLSVNDVQTKIDQWYAVGNLAGIFFDQFGYDFNVSREKQREIVWCVHEKGNGLKSFVNAWNPDDVFSNAVDATHNPNGLETRVGSNDYYLAESFVVMNGVYDNADIDNNNIKDWQDKAIKMSNYKTQFGTEMHCCPTLSAVPYDQNLIDFSYYATVLNQFDGFAVGEENFSASSASLPFRPRPQINGTHFTSPLTYNGDVYSRDTNVGISLDTANHTISDTI